MLEAHSPRRASKPVLNGSSEQPSSSSSSSESASAESNRSPSSVRRVAPRCPTTRAEEMGILSSARTMRDVDGPLESSMSAKCSPRRSSVKRDRKMAVRLARAKREWSSTHRDVDVLTLLRSWAEPGGIVSARSSARVSVSTFGEGASGGEVALTDSLTLTVASAVNRICIIRKTLGSMFHFKYTYARRNNTLVAYPKYSVPEASETAV